ncbi:MAG: metallophosphoesterase, partial [Polyangiaceae bacterium]
MDSLRFALGVFPLLVVMGACSSSPDPSPSREAAVLPPLTSPVALTTTVTIAPTHPRVASFDPSKSPNDLDSRAMLISDGWGTFTSGPGEASTDRTTDGSVAPASGANRKRLVRFAHLADFQTADDESPTKLARFDGDVPLDAAFRPQESRECRIDNAVVRTVNRLHQDAALDFVLLAGDNVDSAQGNELDWFLSILGGNGGKPLACDSGSPNDPVPGPNNDGKDPFVPEGLAVPYYWVTGNHDVLVQGNFPTDAYHDAVVTGDMCTGGTTDYTAPGAPIDDDNVIPDPRRALLQRSDLIARVMADESRSGPKGHGLGAYAQQTGKAFYTADLAPSLRLIALDTACETGGSDGMLRTADVEGFVKPELARAKADGKLVILASHHADDSLGNGSGLGGAVQADAVSPADWVALLLANPHVIAHFAGHSHDHGVRFVGTPGGPGFWEVRTAAIADYPNQFRVIEIWDEDNASISIRAVSVDYATENDPVAADGRALDIVDYASHWGHDG